MLLIGTFDWSSTREEGSFHCPSCECTQDYRLKDSRPFLTLYFIPIVPIGGITESVECRNCREHFESSVLATNAQSSSSADSKSSKLEPRFEQDLLNVMALVMIEDGHVSENEISTARRLYENITEVSISREELGQTCSMMSMHRLSVRSYLMTAGERRKHDERLLIVQAMFGVAGADGEISPGRMKSLLDSQHLLGLDEQEFRQAVEHTHQWLV